MRCDKHIPPSVIIVTKQRFSAHANHRYIGSSRVIPKLAISHSTTFPVADLAPTMVLLQCGDTSQDSELGSDKTCGSMLHLATGIRQKCDLKCVPSCCEERAFTLGHKNDQKCHLLDPFRALYLCCVLMTKTYHLSHHNN